MGTFKTLAGATVLTLASATFAHAADLITVPTSAPSAELPVVDQSTFDWNGFYAGVLGGVQSSPAGGTQYGLGLDVGVNARFDFFLVGGEVTVQGLGGGAGGTTYGQVLGRAGLLATDDVAVYGAAGYGLDLGAPDESDLLVGGGVEVALTDAVSVKAQYLHGFPVTGGNPKDQVTVGAAYHF